jgi:hypothetical protein
MAVDSKVLRPPYTAARPSSDSADRMASVPVHGSSIDAKNPRARKNGALVGFAGKQPPLRASALVGHSLVRH